ncbi:MULTISPECIES: MafI family immunity protein [Rhizobium]|uniref:MafI family immunity protein n=1 Tax=Rhizobium TaxID=379 RepID=UPI0015CF4285|nr:MULTISPECIES: MafI family immunity protein [Rhizobium]MBB3298564.1 archaellum biogenesis protein FlaJ (TadC family) [Rhizobium sp. BK112]MBB3367528.1 archaellum biogenesis protein FlaJ (TadC family) [Rhizobium sp. BK077]MBB4178456.1 archaellum biogenesis protein FlaJ (TadC family) [Rhizobium sp. BK109]UTS87462.1 MafI family immunity protein [Rhizobium anhuiense bv. trifolii]
MSRRFEEIELLFQGLMESAKSELSESECTEIQEYIDVGEYGLALRTAVAIYAEENKVASIAVRDFIRRLASAMNIDVDQLLGRLPN